MDKDPICRRKENKNNKHKNEKKHTVALNNVKTYVSLRIDLPISFLKEY